MYAQETEDVDNLNKQLSNLYNEGKYEEAIPIATKLLEINEKNLGPDHPNTAYSINNLALLYQVMGDYTKAEPLCLRVLKIREKALGPDHPNTARTFNNLSYILLDLQKKPEALKLARKAQHAELETMKNILSFTSEQQRLAFQSTFNPYTLFASMSNDPEIALAILRYKCVVLDSLLEDRLAAEASQNPEHRMLINKLYSVKQRLTQLLLEVPKDLSEQAHIKREAEKEKLSKEVEQLEGTMARYVAGLGSARQALSVTTEHVQKAIPKQTVLLELLRYVHYLGANKYEIRYGVIALTSSGEPHWVTLGEASVIEKTIVQYRRSMHDEIPKVNEKEFSTLLKTLYQQLWSPLKTVLSKNTKNIIISPDGELNFVSFATLLAPDDQFLSQKYSIRYVASGRDLLRDIKPTPTQQMTVYANPDFSGKGLIASKNSSTNLVAMHSLNRRDLQDLYLSPLPGTAKECGLLKAQSGKWNWPIQVFKEAEATEIQLQSVRSPHILHLATHGFFLPESDIEESRGKDDRRGIGGVRPFSEISLNVKSESIINKQVILKNPMLRSGLALVGAQTTLEAWKRGEVPPTDNDGIVTAEEVGGLKLENTWLVTLSACDTGTGEAKSGEGVMGLRRGFIQAGAQNLLMTLWSVADEATAKFMIDFYDTVHKSGNAPKALADVQRKWLVKLRKERGLRAAVILAGPFIMSSQGPP